MLKKSLFVSLLLLLIVFPALGSAQKISLQVFIFSDGSTFLQGSSDIDPVLPVNFDNGKISGITNQLTSKSGNTWSFFLKTSVIFDELYVKIVLPQNSKLVPGSINSTSLPLVYTQDSSLVIEISDLEKPLDISFNYELPLEPVKENKNFLPIALVPTFIILLIIILLFFLKKGVKRKKSKRSMKKESKLKARGKERDIYLFKKKFNRIKHLLNDREVKIIESLIELEGKAKQNQLQKFTNIPKSSFSRHISSLEAKDLIIKKSLGRVNLILLKL